MLEQDSYQSMYNGKIVIPKVFIPPKSFLEFKKYYRDKILSEMKTKPLSKETVRKIILEIVENKFEVNFPLKDKNVKQLYQDLYKHFPNDVFIWKYQLIYEFGFFLSTLKPSSFSPESMILPEEFKKEKERIKKEFENSPKLDGDIIKVNKELKDLAEKVMDYYRKNNISVADLIDSGSKGSVDDIRKLLLGVGLSINSKGEINDVILNAHSEGLKKTQFFNYSSQGIVSLYSKSRNTAKPGYLIRQLYTVLEDLELSKLTDCGTKKYLEIKIPSGEDGKKLLRNLKGRILHDGSIIEDDEEFINKKIKLRSALHCQATDGICKTCYGPLAAENLNIRPGSKIGQLSVASIAESLVNLTLKASHTGLSLDTEEVDLIKDIERYSK